MRVRPLHALLAAWVVSGTGPTHLLCRAAPNALAASPLSPLAANIALLQSRQANGAHALSRRDEHGHGHAHGEPLQELNETLILVYHIPTPPSYGTHDFDGDPNDGTGRYPGLMGLHILFMSLAFFVALPAGIALRSVKHAWHGVSVIAFYGLCALGIASSMLYSKLTPKMYEGAVHAKHGYFVLFIALVLTIIDAFASLRRIYQYAFSVRAGEQQFALHTLWKTVLGKENDDDDIGHGYAHEYTGLVHDEPEEIDMDDMKMSTSNISVHNLRQDDGSSTPVEDHTERWAKNVRNMHGQHRERSSRWRESVASDGTLFNAGMLSPRGSHHSDDTLHDTSSPTSGKRFLSITGKKSCVLGRIGRGTFATTERLLVFLGYMQVLTGLVTYTGVCRDSYVNGCLAHFIKGGIFWCYGLVTFARFLGSFSELGWAWNIAPRSNGNSNVVSAEFVESLVIFLYGISNTWMERFGVPAGTPYSTKEVQHISIAVMFWFAGIVGMGIESRRVRRWLSTPASALYASRSEQTLSPSHSGPSAFPTSEPPPSYRASFNPFPALVIGVTGAAMSAHAQAYVFQVQIHALWGSLLAGFSAIRCLTYFFIWIKPPKSVLPGRPPTEALASFFLACGGLMFQFSTEELTLAAMRRGHADQMMFLNVAVAMTCFAFCWTLVVVAFKGWLKTRALTGTPSGTRQSAPVMANA